MSRRFLSALRYVRAAVPPAPDRDLLAAVRAGGNGEAFGDIVRRHGPMVFGVCRRVLGHRQDAEDAFQATFVVLLRRADRIGKPDSLACWLHGVAVRVCRELLAARRRRTASEAAYDPPAGDPTCPVERAEFASVLDGEIANLPTHYRAAVVLCELEGRSRQRAAAELGIPEGTLSSRLAKARALLADRLAGRGFAGVAIGTAAAEAVPAALAARTVQLLTAADAVSDAVDAAAAGAVKAMTASHFKGVAAAVALLAGGVGALVVAGEQPAPNPAPAAQPPAAVATARVSLPQRAPGQTAIEGVVVDEAGTPVAGAKVTIPRRGDFEPAEFTTGSDGRFRFVLNDVKVSYRVVYAADAEGTRLGRFLSESLLYEPVIEARIVLRPAVPIRVAVVDADAKPVPGATVAVDDFPHLAAHGTTDRQGGVELRVPADAHVQLIAAFKGGVGFDYFENYESYPPVGRQPVPRQVRLMLDGAKTVRFRATDTADRPVSGIPLIPILVGKKEKVAFVASTIFLAALPDGAGLPRTGADGIAVCDWFPLQLTRATPFEPITPGYHCPALPYVDQSSDSEPQPVRLLRTVKCGGKVTNPDGTPAADVVVQAEGCGYTSYYCRAYARTAADGTYRFDLFPDQCYVVAVVDADRAAPAITGMVIREDNPPRENLDFKLEPGTRVEGRVTVGPNRESAANQTIYLKQQGEPVPEELGKEVAGIRVELIRWARTDADGSYRLRLGPGTYQLAGPDMKFEELKVNREEAIARDFHVPRPEGGSFSVAVRKPDGTPAVGAAVTGHILEARSDGTGHVQAMRARGHNGPQMLYAHDAAAGLAGFEAVDPDVAEATVSLRPAAAATGRVVGADGKPRADFVVTCIVRRAADAANKGREGDTVWVRLGTYSGRDGTFSLPPLAVGTACDLHICGKMRCGVEAVKAFTVTEPGPLDLGDITVPPELE